MTRDAEHTPTGYEDAASVVVNQAPAPSSLAGGEVNDEWADRFCEAVNWSPDGEECKTVEGKLRCTTLRQIAKGHILAAIATIPYPNNAALSPEAPAREPEGGAVETVWRCAMTVACNIAIDEQNRTNDDDGPSDVLNAQGEIIRRLKGVLEIDRNYRSEVEAILSFGAEPFITAPSSEAALPPRHEAPERRECDDCGFKGTSDERNKEQDCCTACGENSPAGGPDKCSHCDAKNHMVMACAQCGGRFSLTDDTDHEAPAEGAGEREVLFRALRNYNLTNMGCEDDPHLGYPLVDLMSNDGTEITTGEDEMRVLADHLYAALRARSSAPEAREGEAAPWGHAVKFGANGWGFADDEDPDALDKLRADPEYQVLPLYTHPAGPSADKLRIAVGALERIANEPRPVTRAAMREYASEALAALKAEGAK